MDLQLVLSVLRPNDEWGPGACSGSTYADLVAGWRGSGPVPSQAEIATKWQEIQTAGGVAAIQTADERQRAKQSLAGRAPVERATRAAMRVLYQSVIECRQAINQLRQGQTPPPLAVRTWEQAMAAVQQTIDGE